MVHPVLIYMSNANGCTCVVHDPVNHCQLTEPHFQENHDINSRGNDKCVLQFSLAPFPPHSDRVVFGFQQTNGLSSLCKCLFDNY
jgi:hypothetical protein